MNAATLKRQRRQAAGALVAGIFMGGGGGGSGGTPESQTVSPTKPAEVKGKKSKKKSTAQPRPEIQIPPRGIGPVYEPNENDVLCGRGGRINAHTGNVRFREIVMQRKKEYLAPTTKKLEKAYIAADIVRGIRDKNPSGRFLKEDSDGAWYDIGDAKAIKKVGQALREDAPDIREEIGSDEDEGGEDAKTPSADVKKVVATAPAPLQPIATVPISNTATAVSGRGAKVITTSSQRSVSSQNSNQQAYAPLTYQTITAPPASYQPIVPPAHDPPSKNFFPGTRGRAKPSGAAVAAMRLDDNPSYPPPPTQDIAFGRQFHAPDTTGDSMVSGMSSGTTGGGARANASALSGMSAISALTDPISSLSGTESHYPGSVRQSFQQPIARSQNHAQYEAMRYQQLQHLRQQWAQQRQESSQTLETSDLRSIGNMSMSFQRSYSWQEGHVRQHGDNMSWADHSLLGGGIHDVNSVMSGHHSFHSYYLRDQPMGGSIPLVPTVFGSGSSGPGESSMLRAGSSGLGSASIMGSALLPPQPPHRQSAMPTPAQLYHGASGSSNDGDGSSSDRTNRRAGGAVAPSGSASVASMSVGSGSLSGSIMSELSETLVALDLAEPKLLGQFNP